MKYIIALIVMISSFNLFAQDTFNFYEKASITDPDEYEKSKEIKLDNESILSDVDKELGVNFDPHFTGTENSQIAFSVHTSADFSNLSKILSFEGQYSYKLSDFQDSWISLLVKQTTANYNAIADEVVGSQSNNANANSSTKREENTQNIVSFGAGVGYRFKLFSDWGDSSNFFEKVSAFATFNLATDTTQDDQYQGFGFISDYALYYRSSNSLYYGAKISYNVMALERAAKADEGLADRSLIYGHTSLAFEFGYFY